MPTDQIGDMFEVPGDRLRQLTNQIQVLGDQKDNAYKERDYLVAVLTKLWPSHILQHQPGEDPHWEADWMTVICVHIAGRHLGWHIHDSERHLFSHLMNSPLQVHGYDGMSTAEKYGHLSVLPVTWSKV